MEVAEQGGGVGCLSCISSIFACVVQSALQKLMHKCSATNFRWAKKKGVFCMPLFCKYQDFVEQHADPQPQAELGRIQDCGQCNSGWCRRPAKRQVCCACHFSAGIKILWTKDVREEVPKRICQWARQQQVSRFCGATRRQHSEEKRMLLRQDCAPVKERARPPDRIFAWR